MNLESQNRPAQDLDEIHAQLQALYAAEYPDGAPYLYESLLGRLPEFTGTLVRRKLDIITQYEAGLDRSFDSLTNGEKSGMSMFLDPQVLRAHLDVGRDSALSNDGHSIAHFDTQPPIVAHQLIRVAAGERPETLERMGCVFLDVDGTKTIVDSTSHSHAGKYLEGLAEFLCHPPAQLAEWLAENNLKSEAYSVAGDEFIAVVRSEKGPVTKELLDEFSRQVQQAIAADDHLTSFISFDDPGFIMEYDNWTDDQRKAYAEAPGSMSGHLAISRSKLPDKFIPSVSCGSATFVEALNEALSPDTETAKTLEELGVNAFRLMVQNADARLKVDKRAFRAQMTDPKWKAFLQRNTENRDLQMRIDELEKEIAEVRALVHMALEFMVQTADARPKQDERIAQMNELQQKASLQRDTENPDLLKRIGELEQERAAVHALLRLALEKPGDMITPGIPRSMAT